MKIAVFVEGKSETHLITFFVRRTMVTSRVTNDVTEFVKEENQSIVLVYDCGGSPSVIDTVRDYSDRNWGSLILAVRDTEKYPCYSSLSAEFNGISRNGSEGPKVLTLFAKPCVEVIYADDLNLLGRVLGKIWESNHAGKAPAALYKAIYNIDWSNPVNDLKKICAVHNIAFNKAKVAEKFFSQCDFSQLGSSYFIRLRKIFGACE